MGQIFPPTYPGWSEIHGTLFIKIKIVTLKLEQRFEDPHLHRQNAACIHSVSCIKKKKHNYAHT